MDRWSVDSLVTVDSIVSFCSHGAVVVDGGDIAIPFPIEEEFNDMLLQFIKIFMFVIACACFDLCEFVSGLILWIFENLWFYDLCETD